MALMLLTALMKHYDCGGMRAVVIPAYFSKKSGLKRVY
jgi:hypothetical protein